MSIDDVLPDFDVTRVDTIVVTGAADDVFRAVLDLDLLHVVREDAVVGLLCAVRGIPDRIMHLVRRRRTEPDPDTMRLRDLAAEGEWIRLAEDPGRGIVFGAVGRFWNGPIEWRSSTPQTFASLGAPGLARIAANLAVHPYSPDRALPTYEARTAAMDDDARCGVRRYWRRLSPFIGLVLRSVLGGVKRRVEAAPRGAGAPPAPSKPSTSPSGPGEAR